MKRPTTRLVAHARPAVKKTRLSKANGNLTQTVHEKILNAIVYGRLDLGEPLSENDLAEALGVSKAPIRESLNELRLRGLVVVVPHSGSYVFSPTREEIEELCDFRTLLEQRALQASMEHDARAFTGALKKIVDGMERAYAAADLFESKVLDTGFHQTFFRYSGNRYLTQSYENIRHTVEALRYRFMDTAVYRNRAFAEHHKILEQLNAGNVTKASDILVDHIARTKQFQARVNWSTGRLRRKDYKFREYSDVFAR